MTILKPMLACDADTTKELPGQRIIMPKIDGVRGYHAGPDYGIRGRSGRPFTNKRVVELFSDPALAWLDGEFAVGDIRDPDLCRRTTSVLNSKDAPIDGLVFWVFDDVTYSKLGYWTRYARAAERLTAVVQARHHARLVDGLIVNNLTDALAQDAIYCDEGFEGSILRDPNATYKHGRATQREGSYLRIKQYMDAEILVTGLTEGQTNQNTLEATHLGYAKRSTVADGMAPNGLVATLVGCMMQDVVCPRTGAVLLAKGQEVTVSHGRMTHEERAYLLRNPHDAIGRLAKFKFFPHGVKDKPRHPTFQCWRSPDDM